MFMPSQVGAWRWPTRPGGNPMLVEPFNLSVRCVLKRTAAAVGDFFATPDADRFTKVKQSCSIKILLLRAC